MVVANRSICLYRQCCEMRFLAIKDVVLTKVCARGHVIMCHFFVFVILLKKHDKKHDIISPFFKRCCSRCF